MSTAIEPIYTNWAGYPQTEFSYTLASDMDKCGHYAKLTRIDGFSAVRENSAFKFGICMEAAVIHHYQTGGDPEAEFSKRWQFFSDKPLEYGKRDGDWNKLLGIGRGLMREFLKEKKNLPDLSKAVFGEKMTLKGWRERGDLIYIADAYVKSAGLLVDMKTAAASYPQDPECYPYDPFKRWLAMDAQLRTGCLVSGMREVGFLVFVKTKEPRIQWLTAKVSEPLVEDIDQWLGDQYDKLIARKFNRRSGWRFPNNQCTFCDVSSACLGLDDIAATTLKQRESKNFESMFE